MRQKGVEVQSPMTGVQLGMMDVIVTSSLIIKFFLGFQHED
jgi:hypothetical protein